MKVKVDGTFKSRTGMSVWYESNLSLKFAPNFYSLFYIIDF